MYFAKLIKHFLPVLFFLGVAINMNAQTQPNIIWIYAEDTSPWIGCYGDEINANETPNIDKIAANGVRFDKAFVPAPVCSATRSAIMVGQNSIRVGAHEHRSSRSKETRIYLPEGYKLLPQIMKENGYTTFNNGKSDYNFVWNSKATYSIQTKSKTDFTALKDMQPFFGQIQTQGGKNKTDHFPADRKVNPASVTVPADYPNNAVFRGVVAQHYEAIRKDDDLIGKILAGLKEAGLDKNTIVVYFSDHGANNLLRHKQMTTEGGLHVPFVVMGPAEFVPKKQIRKDLVNMIDLTATTLAWANIEQPSWYEGQDLFAEDFTERTFVGGHKDRLDHTIDRVRTIRSEDYRYVKNYKLDRILLQPQYRDKKDYTKNIHELYKTKKLSKIHEEIYFGERPAEELYNITTDPEMVINLANNSAYENEIEKHRKLLSSWLAKGDKGVEEESIASLKNNGENTPWGEGVNVEYEVYRVDSDGDGLSDKWEELNNRNATDGLLLFNFNNGGWQTEGWFSKDISSNLAGYLGYLDATLDTHEGTISRKDLAVVTTPKDAVLQIKLKSDAALKITAFANSNIIGEAKFKEVNKYKLVEIKLKDANWKGIINSLDITFKGKKEAAIEIDFIRIQRSKK